VAKRLEECHKDYKPATPGRWASSLSSEKHNNKQLLHRNNAFVAFSWAQKEKENAAAREMMIFDGCMSIVSYFCRSFVPYKAISLLRSLINKV